MVPSIEAPCVSTPLLVVLLKAEGLRMESKPRVIRTNAGIATHDNQ